MELLFTLLAECISEGLSPSQAAQIGPLTSAR